MPQIATNNTGRPQCAALLFAARFDLTRVFSLDTGSHNTSVLVYYVVRYTAGVSAWHYAAVHWRPSIESCHLLQGYA
jgi:hypothetical protein